MSSGVSARKWHRFPAQAATIFLSVQKKILHSGAEWCRGAFRADLATKSRAGGYNFSFCAEKDTLFRRGRVPRSVPGRFAGQFRRRTSSAGNPRGLGGQFPRRRLHFSVTGGFGSPFPRRMLPLRYSRRRWRRFPALATKKS